MMLLFDNCDKSASFVVTVKPSQLMTYNLFKKHSRCLCNYIYCIKPSLRMLCFPVSVLKLFALVASNSHSLVVFSTSHLCKYVHSNTVSDLPSLASSLFLKFQGNVTLLNSMIFPSSNSRHHPVLFGLYRTARNVWVITNQYLWCM